MKKFLIATTALVFAGTASIAIAGDGHHDGKKRHHHMEKMFEKIDTNGDGVITKEESLAFHDKKFAKMDADSDGKVTKDEVKAYHEAKRAEYKARHSSDSDVKTESEAAPVSE